MSETEHPSTPEEPAEEPSREPGGSDGPEWRTHGPLSPAETEMLAFERRWWKLPGAKDQAVREQFGISATRYYQVLNRLIDRPEALQHEPMLVQRLRRTRQARRRPGTDRSSATGR